MKKDYKPLIYWAIGVLSTLYIIFTGPVFVLNVPFLLMQFFGLLLIGWALLARKVNINPHKGKLPGKNFFINKGPYEIIRHPIYAGFLLFMLGKIEEELSPQRCFALFLLIIVVLLKISYDENILREHVKDYSEYQAHTHRLIPYFY